MGWFVRFARAKNGGQMAPPVTMFRHNFCQCDFSYTFRNLCLLLWLRSVDHSRVQSSHTRRVQHSFSVILGSPIDLKIHDFHSYRLFLYFLYIKIISLIKKCGGLYIFYITIINIILKAPNASLQGKLFANTLHYVVAELTAYFTQPQRQD